MLSVLYSLQMFFEAFSPYCFYVLLSHKSEYTIEAHQTQDLTEFTKVLLIWDYGCQDTPTMPTNGSETKESNTTNENGVTDIIPKITYPTADPTRPTITVTTERLSTISEKAQHDP